MNRLMGIENDKDAAQIDSATVEEIEEFEEGTAMGPELDPMRPFLASSKHNSWNDELCEMFTEHFEEEQGIELTPEEKDTVEGMFLDRLSRLSRQWTKARKFTESQLFEKEKMTNELARRNTRRLDVSQCPSSFLTLRH